MSRDGPNQESCINRFLLHKQLHPGIFHLRISGTTIQAHHLLETPPIPMLINSKVLTPEEILDKKRKNLCYGCNEKWHPNHHCKTKQVYILEGIMNLGDGKNEEDNSEPCSEEIQEVREEEEPIPAITFHDMCGIPALHTIKVYGSIYGKPVHVLIDSGSTHNFIDCQLAKGIQLETDDTKVFEVQVANGEGLQGKGLCDQVPLKCQGCCMFVDLLLLPLDGCQVVLGAHWMKTLVEVTLNFLKL